jgi:L-cysteine/cystine lyase
MAVDTATEAKVDILRAQLPAVHETGYFNTGTYGPMPAVAIEAAEAVIRSDVMQGRIGPSTYDVNKNRYRRVAALAADIFGADADEIALTHSACEGINTALMGMTWERGDEVVTTSEEHPGLLLPLMLLRQRHGVVSRFADASGSGDHLLQSIASQITTRTRAIALSHVLWSTGAVLPLREVCDLARERNLLVIVDGAQSAGNVPLNLHALGVDAYAMAGQKWLCGPESTGFLYIRRDRFVDIAPTYARYGSFEAGGYFMPSEGASRYEIGEFSAWALSAQEASLRWLRDDVDLDWAYARIAALGADLRFRLESIPGVAVITPVEAMAGLINFNVAGIAPKDVSAALLERGFTIRHVDTKPCSVSARVSVGWWNTEAEVAALAEAVRELAENHGALHD